MRYLIVIAMAALAAACVAPPVQPVAGGATPSKPLVVGTLAAENSHEWRAAPAWTQLIVLRHRAARLLDERRIDLAAAKRIQVLADEARGLLDAAAAADAAADTAKAAALLTEAQLRLTDATLLLGGQR